MTKFKPGLQAWAFCAGLAFGSFMASLMFSNYSSMPAAQLSQPGALLQSLQSSAINYTALQKKLPDKFSDFVQIHGAASGAKTITLQDIKDELSEPPVFSKKILILKFKSEGKATYYLDGIDVTARYAGFH